MSTTPELDADLDRSLARLWQQHRQSNLERISLLEAVTAAVLRGATGSIAISEGTSVAHKLAGSLGTFGFDEGSRAALEAETLLRESVIDGLLLAEAVIRVRSSVADDPARATPVPDDSCYDMVPVSGSGAHVISMDAELVSRLTIEAAAAGLPVTSSGQLPQSDELGPDGPAMFIIDTAIRTWTPSGIVNSVAELARFGLVIVLTERDGFEERKVLVSAGAAGVVSRSQGTRQVVSFLREALARPRATPSMVLATNVGIGLLETLNSCLASPNCHLDIRNDSSTFWETLEDQGADLVVVGSESADLEGPDLCRVIRSDPRWHRLPVIVVGDRDSARVGDAMTAGADDYFGADTPLPELRARLEAQLHRGLLTQSRSEVDPLTGTGNRVAIEHSLDRLVQLSAREGEPFALALLSVDQLAQIRQMEGNAVGNVVLQRLGGRLLDKFGGEDVVGRWTDDGFAVGIFGAGSERAWERITDVLREFAAEEMLTTSGRRSSYTFSAGVASSPADASSLRSLERLSESALLRAQVAQNCVVTAADHPSGQLPGIFDVVLVDDDDSVADVIEHALRLRHCELFRFSDGAEAARALGDGRVKAHVVLLDIGLPSLDGFGVLQTLHAKGILASTRVIMLTARSSEAEMLRALGLGATEYIAKPFSIPILLERLGQGRAGMAA